MATTETLEDYLVDNRIPVISDIDTRALVRHIRLQGSMRGIVSLIDHDEASLLRKVKDAPQMVGWDLASKVSIEKSYSGAKEALTFIEFSTSGRNASRATGMSSRTISESRRTSCAIWFTVAAASPSFRQQRLPRKC